MGGAGNTGQSPYGDSGAAGVAAAAGRPMPDWASTLAPAGAPAAALAPPAPGRPYEAVGSPSTGLLAAPAPAVPTTGPTTGTLGQQPTGFTHSDYPSDPAATPTYGAPAAPVVPETPAAPAQGPMRQIWPPGAGTAGDWVAGNPNWQTDFNRAEQRADGSWWVPTDPNAASPGPKYYQGTGNVTYQGSPAPSGGQR